MERHRIGGMLNGGYIEDYNLDFGRNALTLRVHVLDSGRLSLYEVNFEKMSHFEFETDSRSDAG